MNQHDTTGPRIDQAPQELSDPGSLIASIPAIMGYHPTDGVVLFALYEGAMLLTTHYHHNDPTNRAFATTIAESGKSFSGAAMVACIIGDTDGPPRHDLLAAHLTAAFARNNQELDVFGVPDISTGQRWFQYANPGRGGALPDPDGTPLPLVAARNQVVYPDSGSLLAMLEPDPDDALARRSALLDSIAGRMARHPDEEQPEQLFCLVQREVQRAAHRHEPLTDQKTADLAYALSNLDVRDRCLTFALGEHAAAAERLWTDLVKTCPAPERAEPAVLLALFAFLRGNVLLAVLAQRHAENTVPGHRMATLIGMALDSGAPSSMIRTLAERAQQRYGEATPQPDTTQA
ncbi:DUF4192 domain-containing protein [Saccharothrix sp. NPDC042600]|uniref:DUF4192 domain-containing protein n=1 Tax=Saccharothrix TaxID=2071 RepID=UPI0033C04CD4|nr:DUF4192 domain-containing protein [Saccharothrix mutabilis subsp. capreolus]